MNKTNNVAWEDLSYYDKKIKDYIEQKVTGVATLIPDTYTKTEIDTKIKSVYQADLVKIDGRIDKLAETVSAHTQNLIDLKDHIDENEAAILVLQHDDKLIRKDIADIRVALENKADREDIPSLEGLATEEFVRAKIAEAELGGKDIDLSNYYTKAETQFAIKEAIDKIPETDLSEYVTKEEFQRVSDQSAANNKLILDIGSELVRIDETLETIPTKVSQLDNDAGFLTQIPNEYVTESELESKGYLTEHQSLENYATKEFVAESISNINIPDTSSFITMQEVEAKGYINEIPEEYVTNDELRDAINSIDIPDVDLTNYYTKEETENLIPQDYATKEELEELVKDITINYVTNEQVGETIAEQISENTEVQQSIAKEVSKQIETINYGTFGEEI